ncbi:MAG TPA: DNA-binding transcriptional regulator [Pirellulales bacterium]
MKLLRIGLVLGYGLAFYRDILHGVKTLAAERPHWVLTPIAPDRRALNSPLVKTQHGFIAHVFTPELAAGLRALRKPVVNVSGVLPELRFPRVVVDHQAVGRLAAEHLLERGLRHFAFVGYVEHAFSLGREAGFRSQIERLGHRVAVFHDRVRRPSELNGLWRWNPSLLTWLKSLPTPVGILTSNDSQGVQVSEYCRHLGLHVPDQVAMVGVDDDDLLCDLARPSLSSVQLPGPRIGYEAAVMLERLIRRQRLETSRLELPPVRLVVRQSSDIQAIGDGDVSAAVRYIRDHASEAIDVGDVVRAVAASRRSLERRFRRHLQRGIGQEIRRAHLERAKALLADTDMPMSLVAVRAGFTDSRQLSIVFRQETGSTPTHFRRQHRFRE